MTRIVVADDESHIRRRLVSLPPSVWRDIGHDVFELVGEAEDGDQVELVPVNDVICFQAGQKYVSAVTANREQLLRMSLKDLVSRLDGEKFWRIHRANVVNVSRIKGARRGLRGRYVLQLHDRNETLRCGLACADFFRSM